MRCEEGILRDWGHESGRGVGVLGMKGNQPEADSRLTGENKGREDELEQSRMAHIHENTIIELSVLYV